MKTLASRLTVTHDEDPVEYRKQYNKLYQQLYPDIGRKRVRTENEKLSNKERVLRHYRNNPEYREKVKKYQQRWRKTNEVNRRHEFMYANAIAEGVSPAMAMKMSELYFEIKGACKNLKDFTYEKYPELHIKLIEVFKTMDRFRRICRYKIKNEYKKQ